MIRRVRFLSCILFLILVFISCLYVLREVRTKKEQISNRNANLASLTGIFDELSEKLENGDKSAVNCLSEFILRCGYLSSLNPINSACIYDFLSYLRSDKYSVDSLSAIYARRCADCILQELKGRVVMLDRYNELGLKDTLQTQFKQSGSAIAIASGDTRCVYNSNIYKKYLSTDQEPFEFVDRVEHIGQNAGFELENINTKYLFSDYGIDFYLYTDNAHAILLGYDTEGRLRYYKTS